MSGYGGADDEAQRAMIRVDEQIALARSLLPSGPGTLVCVECGDSIPEARRTAMPGTRYCIECQESRDHVMVTYKEPWAT